jgi:hypothetical protein
MLMNPAFDTSGVLAWVEDRIPNLQGEVEALEAGMRTFVQRVGQGRVETTAESLAEAKRELVELEALWLDMLPASFQAYVR